jgi:hypothetical protein
MVLSGRGSEISTPVDLFRRSGATRWRARTVGRQQEVGRILPFAPLDLVNLLLDLERLEIIELRLM